jgi:NAD(P)-dependent dehydrogenase (short-subunit alcohol dehydrogenase family)
MGRFVQADSSQPDSLANIIDEVARLEQGIDALVNNAAIQICKPLLETTIEDWDLVMTENVRAAFLSSKLAHPLLARRSGAIVHVSSVHAVATSSNIAAYAASKGALLALTRAMALEFGKDNIRVNAILPGAVDTPMLRAGLSRGHLGVSNIEDLVMKLGKSHVRGRIGQPSEIGEAILFLADNTRSAFMTGQALIVDGGATARLSTE